MGGQSCCGGECFGIDSGLGFGGFSTLLLFEIDLCFVNCLHLILVCFGLLC